jgi:hypothetical protein
MTPPDPTKHPKADGWPKEWIVRGRIPPNAAEMIRSAIEETEGENIQRFIFEDWDALDPAVFRSRDRAFKAFVRVFP